MKNKTIKQKIDDLNKLIAWFGSEDFELEKAVDKFEEASKLAESVDEDLKNLKNEVTVLKKKFDTATN